MEYQNTDDAIRRDACEKVKQIVKAIKAIKIKYYLIFSRISEEDNERLQKLEKQLEKISEEHDLNKLKVALMKEVDERYNGQSPEDMQQREHNEPDNLLKSCYGAIDAQKEALSKGRIAQAIRCQEQLKKYKQHLDDAGRKEVTNYKREKFAELMQTRDQLEEQIKSWTSTMKGMYKIKHVQKRPKAWQAVQEGQKEEIQEAVVANEENSVVI